MMYWWPDAELDPEEVASQIAELRAQIEALSFVTEPQEEPETDDESEWCLRERR